MGTAAGPHAGARGAAHPLSEAARLASLWRLTLGAVHTLNNSLAAILGEASFLLSDRKDDHEVSEACLSIQREVERCARLTRALLARRTPGQNAQEPVELGRLLLDLEGVLRDTLSRRFELDLELPGDTLFVDAPSPDLEGLVLLLIHQCCDARPEGGRLRLRLVPDVAAAELQVELARDAAAPEIPVWRSPQTGFDLGFARALADPYGIELDAEESAAALRLRARFPLCAAESD